MSAPCRSCKTIWGDRDENGHCPKCKRPTEDELLQQITLSMAIWKLDKFCSEYEASLAAIEGGEDLYEAGQLKGIKDSITVLRNMAKRNEQYCKD